jgi:hypothetical protein
VASKGDPFHATAAVGQDWHIVDTMGSVLVGDGRVVLRDRNGAAIVEAPASEVYARRFFFATRIWMGGERYSIEQPKKRPSSLALRPDRTVFIRREFLRALQAHGGHIGSPLD